MATKRESYKNHICYVEWSLLLKHIFTPLSLTFFLLSFFCNSLISQGSYAPPAGQIGSNAIHKDSSIIKEWANYCTVTRGYQQIDSTSLGYASAGNNWDATGYADGKTVSLGDGGNAIYQLTNPIFNGSGYDFVIYENAFNSTFLELAFVEVSSDGINFFRFPNYSQTQDTIQLGNFDALDATNIHNLAGKYQIFYGTPFDLDDIPDTNHLNKNNITHIKIIDVIGTINEQFASYDFNNHIINDPWPTPWPTSGFDLDALGLINVNSSTSLYELANTVSIFPNPAKNNINITSKYAVEKIEITNLMGSKLVEFKSLNYNINYLKKGTYILKIHTKKGIIVKRFVKD